jgi:hypothetical protein
LQLLAEAIGENCGVERWTIDLFAEEVVRGGPAFGVSLVLATVEPALRRCADLGSWQIISPADVVGAPLPGAPCVFMPCMHVRSTRSAAAVVMVRAAVQAASQRCRL